MYRAIVAAPARIRLAENSRHAQGVALFDPRPSIVFAQDRLAAHDVRSGEYIWYHWLCCCSAQISYAGTGADAPCLAPLSPRPRDATRPSANGFTMMKASRDAVRSTPDDRAA